MNYIKCPKCHAEIEEDSFYCDQCGEELFVCPKCGTFGKGKRCTRCGEPLVAAKDRGKVQDVSSTPKESASQPPSQQVPQPDAASSNKSAPGQSNSITSDIDQIIGNVGGTGTIRPGNLGQTTPPPRQVPGHLVCANPKLRLYIDEVIIGRRDGGYASVFASFGMVSGRHAQISRTPSGDWQVTDLGSTNGTRINGRPLAPNVPVPFWVGDTITFADIDFEVQP